MFIVYDTKKSSKDYIDQCAVVNSLDSLIQVGPTSQDIVFIGDVHSEMINDQTFISRLSDILTTVGKAIYARSIDEDIPSIDMVIQSVNGEIYPASNYLDSYDGLVYLNSGKAKKALSTDIGDSLSLVVNNLKPKLSRGQLILLNNSVRDIQDTHVAYVDAVSSIAKSAVKIISDSSEKVESLQKNYKKTKEVAKEVTAALKAQTTRRGPSTLKSFYTYPQVKIIPTPGKSYKFLKTAGPVQFLTSTALGYCDYLRKLGKKPKLIIIGISNSVTDRVLLNIENSSIITASSSDKDIQRSAIASRVSIVVHPIETIINILLSVDLFSDFIIIDRTNNKLPQISGISPILWCADSQTWLDNYTSDQAFFGRISKHPIRIIDDYHDYTLQQKKSWYASQQGIYKSLENV